MEEDELLPLIVVADSQTRQRQIRDVGRKKVCLGLDCSDPTRSWQVKCLMLFSSYIFSMLLISKHLKKDSDLLITKEKIIIIPSVLFKGVNNTLILMIIDLLKWLARYNCKRSNNPQKNRRSVLTEN